MAKTVLIIEGMSCGMCSNKVDQFLKKVNKVTSVTIDLKKGTAEVIHDGVKDEELIRAVVDAGYRAKVKQGLFK